MIVHRPELQAYECDGCGKVYEIRRNRGSEDDLNRDLDFRKRIELRHEGCVSQAVIDAMQVQSSTG